MVTSGSMDHSTIVNWPSGENVKISVTWYVGGTSVSDDVIINSRKVETKEDGFEIRLVRNIWVVWLRMGGIFAVQSRIL